MVLYRSSASDVHMRIVSRKLCTQQENMVSEMTLDTLFLFHNSMVVGSDNEDYNATSSGRNVNQITLANDVLLDSTTGSRDLTTVSDANTANNSTTPAGQKYNLHHLHPARSGHLRIYSGVGLTILLGLLCFPMFDSFF